MEEEEEEAANHPYKEQAKVQESRPVVAHMHAKVSNKAPERE